MIKNPEQLRKWEKQQLMRAPRDFIHALRLFEAMYEEARALGVLLLKNPLEGIETKIHFAQKINVSTAAGKDCPGS